ncbi:hypothetical protein ACJ41O_003816 [Fusarium nematophilum]
MVPIAPLCFVSRKTYRTQSPWSSIPSTAVSAVDGNLLPLEGRIDAAYTAVSSGDLYKTIIDIHDPYTKTNGKRLYIVRAITSNKEAQGFKDHWFEVLGGVDAHRHDAANLSHLDSLMLNLITNLYLKLNKDKTARGESEYGKGKGRGRGKAVGIEPLVGKC